MSKLGKGFWAAGSSSDEDGSKSGSDSDGQGAMPTAGRTTGRFQMSGSSSDSEEVVRVAKSKQDRAWDDLREHVTKIRNSMKTSDWSSCEEHWKECIRKMETSKKRILEKGIPPFYIKLLASMEDTLNGLNKEALKKMKPAVGKAAANLKTVIKKHNLTYQTDISDFRQNPDKYESASEEDSDSDSDSESGSDDSDSDSDEDEKPVTKAVSAKKTAKAEESDEESEDSMFGSSDSESDSSSDDEAEVDGRPVLVGRARWLKKPEAVNKTKSTKDLSKTRAAQIAGAKPSKDEAPAKTAQPTPRKVPQVQERALTEEELQSKLADLISARGRKGTDPREMLRKLEVLTRGARRFGAKVEIPVLMHLVSAMYDAVRGIDDYMDVQQWRTCFRCLIRITSLLESHAGLTLGVLSAEDTTDLLVKAQQVNLIRKRDSDAAEEEKSPVNPNVVPVVGTLSSFVQRLEDEYTKALQQINPHTSEYVARLSDEGSLIELAEAIYNYYRRVGDSNAAATVALLHVEHIYYKHDTVAKAVSRAHAFNKKWGRFGDIHPSCTSKMTVVNAAQRDVTKAHPATFSGYPIVEVPPSNPTAKIADLTQFIFKHADERTKTRALLCSVFHHALHDRFYRARDLFLISHIQDVIDKADISTQILYNRVLASLGLSAFREGLIQKAHDCLQNICSGRPLQVRELLAQGQVRHPDKDPEQERNERRRLIPYHMHINPDLLDSCHLTCAMLLELPYMARGMTAVNPVNQNIVSRQFRKFMQNYNRQVFTGPPENTREHVMAAAKSMVVGDWQKACDYILGMDVWNLIPNDGGAKVKTMLSNKLKEEAVRTYLLSNGVSAYSSLSLSHLCETFDTQPEPTRRIVSRMIFNKEISAAWEADNTLVLHKMDPNPTQSLAVKVADKVAALVETNERLLDPLAGGHMYGARGDDWNRDGRRQWQGAHGKDDARENREGSRRYLKSGAVGRGGGDYVKGGNRRDGDDRGGHRGRGSRDNKGHRGGYANKHNTSSGNGTSAGENGTKAEGPKSVWGKPTSAPTTAPKAWGANKQ